MIMGSMNHELQFLQSNRYSEQSDTSESHALRKERLISRKILIFASTVALTGIVCLVVGIVLLRINRAQNDDALSASLNPDDTTGTEKDDRATEAKTSRNYTESCSYSLEFKKSGTQR